MEQIEEPEPDENLRYRVSLKLSFICFERDGWAVVVYKHSHVELQTG